MVRHRELARSVPMNIGNLRLAQLTQFAFS